MPKRSKAELEALITAAARLFATRTRDAKEIAKLLDTSDQSVRRWAKTERWEETLQTLAYAGERNFSIKPKRSNDALVTAAARLFATRTRDAKKIAALLNTTERNVHRWAKTELWEETLQSLGYEGERNFRVKPKRSTDTLITAAARLFATRTRDAKKIAKLLNTKERSVRRWAKTELWGETLQSLGYAGERKFIRKPRQS